MMKFLSVSMLVLTACAGLSACADRVPTPIVDVERGTALPPPGLVEALRR
jgi:hypothetical protein